MRLKMRTGRFIHFTLWIYQNKEGFLLLEIYMKLCPKCHQESPDGANFCANCGETLESKKQEVVVIITQSPSAPSKKLSRKAKYKENQDLFKAQETENEVQNKLDKEEVTSSKGKEEKENSSLDQDQKTSKDKKQEIKKDQQDPSQSKEDQKDQQEKNEKDKNQKDKDEKDQGIEKDDQKKKKEKHGFLFFKKTSFQEDENEEENEENEEEEEDQENEDSQKWMVAAISFLGLLVILLSGLLIYQGMLPQEEDSPEKVAIQEESTGDFEIAEVKENSSSQSSSEKAQTKTLANQYTEEGKRRPVRAYERGVSQEESEESSLEKETSSKTSQAKDTKNSTSSNHSTTSYQTNFVMNVRTGPSIDEDQVNQMDAGETIEIEKTQTNSDGSTWGKIAGSENWICISDSDTQYLTKINGQNESSPIASASKTSAKIDIDDLIEQAGSVWNLFDNAMLIGDSRVYGFMSYGFIPANQVKAAGGYTINNIPEFLSAVQAMQPEVIYLSFGINDMGLNIGQEEGEDGYGIVYTRQIESLLERVDAKIVVNSVIDATPAAVARSPRWDKVADFNRQIKQMCQEHNWIYVDNDSLAQGGNAPIYNADGVHLVSTFYEPWAKNMLKARYSQE